MGPGNWFLQKEPALASQCHILASSGSSLTPPTGSHRKGYASGGLVVSHTREQWSWGVRGLDLRVPVF